MNPFAFMKIYTGPNKALKQLMTICTLQCCLEGRCTTDVFQNWARSDLQWGDADVRNFVMGWGSAVTLAGMFVCPLLLRRMSARGFTTFTNLFTWVGVSLFGVGSSWGMYAGIPLISSGVNGQNATRCVRWPRTWLQRRASGRASSRPG